jgi:murein DD-endopeptidase MepM/ murein hydrolase activator NlpD
VRDRLLARAAEAKRARSGAEQTTSTRDGNDLLGTFTDELDRVATRAHAPSAPELAMGRRELSPNVIALFGTLFGLAGIAALFAVLIHVDPRDGTPLATPAPTPPLAAIASAAPVTTPLPTPPLVKKADRPKLPGPFRVTDNTDPKLRKIEATIGHDSFLKALEDAGIAHAQTFRILKVMKDLRDLDHCGRSDKFYALVDRSTSRVVAFEYVVSLEEVYQAREGQDGFLKAQKLDLHVERARVQGAIVFDRPTFQSSAESQGFESGLSSVIDEALMGHSTVADFGRGDRVRVVAQEVTVLGQFERYAGIEALEVVPRDGNKHPLRIYYFRGTKSHGYYDAEGRAVHEGGWRRPLKVVRITSPFNPHRMHPILKKPMPHQGTDMGAALGTPVGAAGPGTVKFIGNGGATGNLVTIEHAGNIETGYAHLSRFEPGLKVGDRVQPLQIVGYVGSTGRSTGPHLHFSVKKNGVFIDSQTLKYDVLRTLPPDERIEFVETRTKLDALLDAIPLPGAPTLAPLPEPEAPATDDAASDDIETNAPLPTSNAGLGAAPSAALPAPAAPPVSPAPGPVGPGPAPARGPSIYLSDQDLLKNQPKTDDGEVEE